MLVYWSLGVLPSLYRSSLFMAIQHAKTTVFRPPSPYQPLLPIQTVLRHTIEVNTKRYLTVTRLTKLDRSR